MRECPICRKHRGEGELVGPVIYADEVIHVAHRASGSLGYVFIEPRRHVASPAELTDAEAGAIGLARSRLARALEAELDVLAVHAFVAGLAVPHLHEHVFVRHRGTPDDAPWWPPWPGAPEGDIESLAARLRRHLG